MVERPNVFFKLVRYSSKEKARQFSSPGIRTKKIVIVSGPA